VTPFDHPPLPNRSFLFVESYCADRGCDCRRVLVAVFDVERRKQVATINHGFEPPKPPHEDEGQTFLDPLNPQSPWSKLFLEIFQRMIEDPDDDFGPRLVRHYDLWKSAVNDPLHPGQAALRQGGGDPELLRQQPVLAGPKVGPNAPCPCGSGKKYKRCCRP
jgi:hypothetical protein